jgi:3-isopropylmalate dehydrogenase
LGSYEIVVIQGDGVGSEIIPEALRVLKVLCDSVDNLELEFTELPIGAHQYLQTGKSVSRDDLSVCSRADAILKGPVGLPNVRYDDGTEVGIGIELSLRFELDLYANIRPVVLSEGVRTVLPGKKPGQIDYTIVRENTEGLYAAHRSGILRDKMAVDPLVMTENGVKRVVRKAFELSKNSKGSPCDGKRRVMCVDKSNVLRSFAFFRSKFDEVAKEYPDVQKDYMYADAVTQQMLFSPERLNILVTENYTGDILSDLASATVGGLGLAGSANLGEDAGLFEAVHGSAPDIAGKGIANPIAILNATALMLEWLEERHASELTTAGIRKLLKEGTTLTPDLGGTSSTKQVGAAIASIIKELAAA